MRDKGTGGKTEYIIPIRLQMYTFRVPTPVGVLRRFPPATRGGVVRTKAILALARGTRPKAGSSNLNANRYKTWAAGRIFLKRISSVL
jgi:hypothetical protein